MSWQLLPGAVIGRQANEAFPTTSEDLRAKKVQFDIKTERTWPNAEPSNRAKYTREHVLREFLQIFVKALEKPYLHTHLRNQNQCSPTLWQ